MVVIDLELTCPKRSSTVMVANRATARFVNIESTLHVHTYSAVNIAIRAYVSAVNIVQTIILTKLYWCACTVHRSGRHRYDRNQICGKDFQGGKVPHS